MPRYRSPIARARGLGPARTGLHDWWRQRLTAVALIPLGLWFTFSLAMLPTASYPAVVAWLQAPWNSLLLLSFIVSVCCHSMLGLQTVVEDYVHGSELKLACLLGIKLGFSFLALTAIYATLRIALAG
ncbi:MAG: succinate dehydrogenase, hydrophobic membrane anchor protein [Methylococcus sp.]|nr:succinate dehydrogenase, hydrophobic membrane anchor protein [Methylococcus sp.]